MPLSARPRPTPGRVFAIAAAILGVLSVSWALATPVFASPDENAHAVKAIAQVRGDLFGERVEGIARPVYDLPEGYRYSPQLVCFAFTPTAHAGCGVELGDEGTDWFASWVSTYNPIYYYVVGWPTLFLDGSAGVYAMRILSALLCSVLLAAAAAAAASAARARWMPIGVAFLASPMVMFLSGSVNPQGVEIAAGALLVIAVLRLGEQHLDPSTVEMSRRAVWAITTVAAVLLANARGIGPLWVVILVLGAFAMLGWRATKAVFAQRGSYPWIAVIAVAGVFAIAWTLSTGLIATQAVVGDAPLVGGSFLEGAWAMLRDTYRWLQESAGVFGWLDTALPSMAYAVFFAAVGIVLALALTAPPRRERLVVVVAIAVAVLVPVVVQAAQVSRTGIIWQGRYSMFLYLGVLLVAAWALSRASSEIDRLAPRLTLVVSGMLAAYGLAAFSFTLHRYVVGSEGTVGQMLSNPYWQPPLGWIALVVIYAIGSAALAAATTLHARRLAAAA